MTLLSPQKPRGFYFCTFIIAPISLDCNYLLLEFLLHQIELMCICNTKHRARNMVVLPKSSLLCLLHDRPINWEMRQVVGARNNDVNQKASGLRRWQTSVSKNHLPSVQFWRKSIYRGRGGGGAHCSADQWLSGSTSGCWLTVAHSLNIAHLGEGSTVTLTNG